MVVMEELGRGMVLEPLAHAFIASSVLSHGAPADVQAAWLPRIASGQALVVLAQQERKARYALEKCEAKSGSSAIRICGNSYQSIVPAGDQADAFLVPAQLDGHIALFLVERSASGVNTQGYVTQDGSRAAEVQFTNTPAALVTKDGLAALELAVDTGILPPCAPKPWA